jgi:hypothetical protein
MVSSGLKRCVGRPGSRCDPGEQALMQNPDKDEAPGSSPGRPTIQPLTSGNVVSAHRDSGFERICVRDEVWSFEPSRWWGPG